jgi:magnesium chelatase family protein
VKPGEMHALAAGESSAMVARRVAAARELQAERYAAEGIRVNAQADGEVLEHHCTPDTEGKALLMQGAEKLGLSMRGYTRVLRVARTIADMENTATIRKAHIAEALAFRQASYRQKVA